jgi:hypothetical protein
LRGYLCCCPPTAIDSFNSFNILELVDFLLTAAISEHLGVARPLARLLHWTEMRGFDGVLESTNLEVLEEVFIMAAMNLLTSAATARKREKRASHKSEGDQAWN